MDSELREWFHKQIDDYHNGRMPRDYRKCWEKMIRENKEEYDNYLKKLNKMYAS